MQNRLFNPWILSSLPVMQNNSSLVRLCWSSPLNATSLYTATLYLTPVCCPCIPPGLNTTVAPSPEQDPTLCNPCIPTSSPQCRHLLKRPRNIMRCHWPLAHCRIPNTCCDCTSPVHAVSPLFVRAAPPIATCNAVDPSRPCWSPQAWSLQMRRGTQATWWGCQALWWGTSMWIRCPCGHS